jgi:hypothetical protein
MLLEGTRPSRLWIGTTCIERRSCAASLGERGSAQRIGPIKRHNRRATVTSPELTWKIECGRFWSMRNRLDKIECCAVLGRNRLTGRLQIPVVAIYVGPNCSARARATSIPNVFSHVNLDPLLGGCRGNDRRQAILRSRPLSLGRCSSDPVVIPRRGPKRTHR